jgi:hypothetical protein
MYFPIEITEGNVLCFGKNDSVLMTGVSSISLTNITTLSNNSLGAYSGLKYGSLLLNRSDLLLCNGTSLNVVEFKGDKFALLDSQMDIDCECVDDSLKMLSDFIKKNEYEYMIVIVNKSKCKLNILNVIKN